MAVIRPDPTAPNSFCHLLAPRSRLGTRTKPRKGTVFRVRARFRSFRRWYGANLLLGLGLGGCVCFHTNRSSSCCPVHRPETAQSIHKTGQKDVSTPNWCRGIIGKTCFCATVSLCLVPNRLNFTGFRDDWASKQAKHTCLDTQDQFQKRAWLTDWGPLSTHFGVHTRPATTKDEAKWATLRPNPGSRGASGPF